MDGRRSLMMTYGKGSHLGTLEPSNGVYIQDIDGYFHATDDWTGEYVPNGVAVISDECRFVIALEDVSIACQWGGSSNIAAATDEYSGVANTTAIINALGQGAYAAWYCRAYTFPDGSVGYLGAQFEWFSVVDNKSAIDTAFSACGGVALGTRRYWTSTQSMSDRGWAVDLSTTYAHNTLKTSKQYVRPFAMLDF